MKRFSSIFTAALVALVAAVNIARANEFEDTSVGLMRVQVGITNENGGTYTIAQPTIVSTNPCTVGALTAASITSSGYSQTGTNGNFSGSVTTATLRVTGSSVLSGIATLGATQTVWSAAAAISTNTVVTSNPALQVNVNGTNYLIKLFPN
jgi:hypothetical protein